MSHVFIQGAGLTRAQIDAARPPRGGFLVRLVGWMGRLRLA